MAVGKQVSDVTSRFESTMFNDELGCRQVDSFTPPLHNSPLIHTARHHTGLSTTAEYTGWLTLDRLNHWSADSLSADALVG